MPALFTRRDLLGATRNPIRLPWTLSDEAFTDGCTRCGKCLEACPTKIIAAAGGGFPAIDFSRGECTFCGKCVDACPEPLFRPREQAPFGHTMQIDSACLPRHGIECRSCGDACEPAAIRFQFNARRLAEPELDPARCTGCGACISACPADAIGIRPVELA